MVMFAEKVLRRLGGNWTFVIVTDRQELDDQIAGTFAAVGALTKNIKDARRRAACICASCWRGRNATSSP